LHTRAARYGYPYAIELAAKDYWRGPWQSPSPRDRFIDLTYKLKEKYGRDYRHWYKRPNRRAKYFIDSRQSFIRVCFKNEHDRTVALLTL
jgi:hypothetical protein